jgi:sugar/nucleoside kinase (ribokinase family)
VFSVYGIENPLMDIIAHVEHSYLRRLGKKPGTMNLVESSEVELLMSGLSSCRSVPGGSCANTVRGIAWLNRSGRFPPPVFNGSVGEDPTGDAYISAIQAFGVVPAIARKPLPTGVSLILVTPDGERTMNTHLGACRGFGPADLDRDMLAKSRILHLTGYLWDTENQRLSALEAAELARRAGITVSFDIADPYAVQRYRGAFLDFAREYVDVLFANREELGLLTGTDCDEDCVAASSPLAPTVVMKAGRDGCIVTGKGRSSVAVPGVSARLVDTTGAGDAFAAGFLYGTLAGREDVECARLANTLAAAIVGVEGCDYTLLGTIPGIDD